MRLSYRFYFIEIVSSGYFFGGIACHWRGRYIDWDGREGTTNIIGDLPTVAGGPRGSLL